MVESPAANWERAETPVRQVNPAWDGGDNDIRGLDLDLVFSGTQAQRVVKIMAKRAELGKSLSATFPPAAIQALAGGRVFARVCGRKQRQQEALATGCADIRGIDAHPAQPLRVAVAGGAQFQAVAAAFAQPPLQRLRRGAAPAPPRPSAIR